MKNYKDIRFMEYTITLSRVAIFGDIKLTSREEYLNDNVSLAMDILLRYGDENSTLLITIEEIGFTDAEILALEETHKELDILIPVSKSGGDNPF